MSTIQDNTTWDDRHVFSSFEDPKIEEIFQTSEEETKKLQTLCSNMDDIDQAKIALRKRHDLQVDLGTLSSYCYNVSAVDAKNETAKALLSRLRITQTNLSKATTALDLFVLNLDEAGFAALLDDEVVSNMNFTLTHARKLKDFQLSTKEEKLIKGFSVDGLNAWGTLYNSIAGSMTCEVDGQTLGYANTASLLRQDDRDKRKSAWDGIQKSWAQHEESSAAILNAINGWRIENQKVRSTSKKLDGLDISVHQNHITRKTLDALMETTYQYRSVGQRASKATAKIMGMDQLAPWDLLAATPKEITQGKTYGFKEAIDLIAQGFSELTPEMGDFVHMMYEKNWIDSKESTNRSPGAYCTELRSVREPRVFITYQGSMGDLITLAHELGHAYHAWVMRDLHLSKTHYAMTTAETASIFGETLMRDFLFEKATTKEEKLAIAWQDAESASAMLCNIPARFEFEKNLVQARMERSQTPTELKSMMKNAWGKWYEDTLSQYDEMFWASKLHFSISEIGFYNYPYLFGYLFSLGIYAQREKHGDKFNTLYTNILRDTGSMNAVELIDKHLGKSIEEKSFWEDSIKIVDKAVSRLESLI